MEWEGRVRRRPGRTPKKPIPDVIESIQWYESIARRLVRRDHIALFYALYLTGGRVSEVLGITPESFIPLRAPDGKKKPALSMPNLKNKKRISKIVPITGLFGEKEMGRFLWDYKSQFRTGRIFNMNRFSANKAIGKILINIRKQDPITRKFIDDQPFRVHPHWLRHSRLTHLVHFYHYDALRLTEFAGWSDTRPAMTYIRMSPESLLNPLLAVAKVDHLGD